MRSLVLATLLLLLPACRPAPPTTGTLTVDGVEHRFDSISFHHPDGPRVSWTMNGYHFTTVNSHVTVTWDRPEKTP